LWPCGEPLSIPSMVYRGPEDAGAKSGDVGRIVHVLGVYSFEGDIVMLVGECRELCSVEEVDKVDTS
jgi:hypothetical protein